MLVYHKYIQIPNSYCSCSCTEVANYLAEAQLFWAEQMPTPFCVASYIAIRIWGIDKRFENLQNET